MDKKRKPIPIGRYLLLAWILFLYLFAGYYALPVNNQPLFANVDILLPRDFHARLMKHGLNKQFSAIEMSNGILYFYRDGKRCTF
jgi:hypothetical protein